MVDVRKVYMRGYPVVSDQGLVVGVSHVKDMFETRSDSNRPANWYAIMLDREMREIRVCLFDIDEVSEVVYETGDVWEFIEQMIIDEDMVASVIGEGLYDGYRVNRMGLMGLDTAFVYSLCERPDGFTEENVSDILNLSVEEVSELYADGQRIIDETSIVVDDMSARY